jgi:LAS superfamily LD-carboxypeptidase LdcB
MTTEGGHNHLQKSIDTAREVASNIAKSGNANGHAPHQLPTYNGYYMPKPNSPADKLYRFLIKDVHLTPAAAAGGVGSFSVESASFKVINGFGGGGNQFYGLGQWDPVSRAPRLKLFTRKNGLDYKSFDGQLAFVKHELTTSEKATLWRLRHFNGSVGDAASLWGRMYERAVNPDGSLQGEPTRRARATEYLHEIEHEKQIEERRIASENAANSEQADWRDKVADLGMHTTYVKGKKVMQRLYAVHDLPSSGDESEPGNQFYIDGSEGRAIASEAAAQKLVKLVHMAKVDGVHLQLKSSTRTDKHQQYLAAQNPDRNEVARPKYSKHEGAAAFDFDLDGLPLVATDYPTLHDGPANDEDNPRTAKQSRTWNWLVKNAPKVGLKMYFNEPWHWSLDGK